MNRKFCRAKLLALGIQVFALLMQSCQGNELSPKTDAEKNMEILTSGTWILQSVRVDEVDKTSMYAGLKLTFSSSSYTSVNGGPIWENNTWSFTNDTGTEIERGDGLLILIDKIDSGNLVLSLLWNETTLDLGRQYSVAGAHVFTFTK